MNKQSADNGTTLGDSLSEPIAETSDTDVVKGVNVVPDVTGYTEEEAVYILEDLGAMIDIIYVESSDNAIGYVVETNEVGKEITDSLLVEVYVGNGSSNTNSESGIQTVPELTGYGEQIAIQILENLGAQYEILYEYNDNYSEGVVSMTNHVGEIINSSLLIEIYVSQGKKPDLENDSETTTTESEEEVEETAIEFKDSDIEAEVRSLLNKPTGAIFTTDVMEISELRIYEGTNVSKVDDLKYFTNLENIYMPYNNISDIIPLSQLTKLKSLDIGINRISNINVISHLDSLEELWIYDNDVSDISVFQYQTDLIALGIGKNPIKDYSPIRYLRNLYYLELYENDISDTSFLRDMTQVEELMIQQNKITTLDDIVTMTNLKKLNISDNPITDYSVLNGLSKLSELEIDGDDDFDDFEYLEVSVTSDKIVVIPDDNFEDLVREIIGKETGDIYHSELKTIFEIDASNRGIYSLEGIQYFDNLKRLSLGWNYISDISMLSGLTKLEDLQMNDNFKNDNYIQENKLQVDLTGLENLSSLKSFGPSVADNEMIAYIGTHFTNLEELWLEGGNFNTIAPLTNLTSLRRLSLSSNSINDIENLQYMKNLEWLDLSRTYTGDLYYLLPLTNLQYLEIDGDSNGDDDFDDFEYLPSQ